MSTPITHPKHILAPVDFSVPCKPGLTAAIDLARRFGAELTLVHVVKHLPHGSHVVMDLVGLQQDWMRPAKERLAEFAKEHVPEDRCARLEVAHGKPFNEIVQLADRLACDLIVMSTHGHTDLAHMFIGSTAERVVQHAPCPVMVVPGRTEDSTSPASSVASFHSVLVTTDFSDYSRIAFPLAAAMAKEFKAKLTLTHVTPPMMAPIGPLGESLPIDYTALINARQTFAQNELNKLHAEHFDADAETLLLDGRPHQSICDAAAARLPALIVMSTHGSTGWEHALIGSTAERVVRHAPCPVLVVRDK